MKIRSQLNLRYIGRVSGKEVLFENFNACCEKEPNWVNIPLEEPNGKDNNVSKHLF